MKRILKILLFIFFLTVSIYLYDLVTINWMNKNFQISYGRGLEYKFDKLASIESNKIVIVGGSNVSFGIDSDIIERELEIPTVNMGLHASFYSYVIIEPVLPYLKEGDVLIISREFGDKNIYGSSLEVSNYFGFMPFRAKKEVYKNFDAISPILKQQILNSQKNVVNYKFEKQLTFRKGPYSFNAFRNDNLLDGEIDFEMAQGQYDGFQRSPLGPVSSQEVIDYYKSIYERLQEKGIKVYFSLPSIVDKLYEESEMINYYEKLSSDTRIPLLSNRTYIFPRKKMSNSIYHLNKEGRAYRSYEMSKDFSKATGIPINDTKEKKRYTIDKKESSNNIQQLAINDCYLGKYDVDTDSLTFKATDPKKVTNYYRIRTPGNIYNGKSFKFTLSGNENILKDIKFRAIGRFESWDEINIKSPTQWEFVKNNVLNAYYKDDHSYVGLAINNVLSHNETSVKVESILLSDNPFTSLKQSLMLKQNQRYMLSIGKDFEKNNNLIEGIDFDFEKNKRYIISYNNNLLTIRDLYDGTNVEINKETTRSLTITTINSKIDVFEL